MPPQPFRIAISDDAIADLKRRIAATRWPGEVTDSGWRYGTNLGYARELAQYWLDSYDWRAHEAALNEFSQFQTPVDDLAIHFVHKRGTGPAPMPLILTHGWPGSFYEMHKVIDQLADPGAHGGDAADAFDVVVPSLPGYGFSEAPTVAGVGPTRVADLWATLMTELGYDRFGAQGGDWGSIVTGLIGRRHPQRTIGLHFNMIGLRPAPSDRRATDPAEQAFIDAARRWRADEGGYSTIQGTRPQSLAYGLTDSPTGLAAWIVEKWWAWSDCDGNVENSFTKDELLTNISIYWFTNTINSANRFYYESRHDAGQTLEPGERITPPAGFAMFPAELLRPPRSFLERTYDIHRWTEMPRGGHFAAMEEPQLLVDDIRAFFRPLR